MKDFFVSLLFFGLTGYFIYLIVQNMPQLFTETTTIKQYGLLVYRLIMVFVLFNLGIVSSKNYKRSKPA
ncbi:sulfate permease [Solibacillus sp. FSL H8-0538]|uniref:sulfate permease n=1 Tax=Solibacillus sp. FSL H8-0538 TaxID=2921400 RepID=UPI0030F66F29